MADCKKVQKMIGKFDHGQLDIKQEEFFIQHVESCKDCREEFEIYYIVAYGLSEDENTAAVAKCYQKLVEQYDFKGLVELKMCIRDRYYAGNPYRNSQSGRYRHAHF